MVPRFQIEKGIDCADSYPTRKAVSPSLKKCGVYLIFDDDSFESLRYIGMAPDRSLIHRIRNHRMNKRFTPRWIDVIALDYPWSFLVPSLESFLIDRVIRIEGNTLVNVRGTFPAYVARVMTTALSIIERDA